MRIRCFDDVECCAAQQAARARLPTSETWTNPITTAASKEKWKNCEKKEKENQMTLSTGWLSEVGLDRPGFQCPAAPVSTDARACKFGVERTPLPGAVLRLRAGSRGLTVVGK